MCRMLALMGRNPQSLSALMAFQRQARRADTGPEEDRRHSDGWGAVLAQGGSVERVARSTLDAFEDPAYDELVRRYRATKGLPIVLVHFRNASVGEVTPENTHPFLDQGWAFAHNGTIHGEHMLAVPGARFEGATDSERYFRRFLLELSTVKDPVTALRRTVRQIDAFCDFSSLTVLFTDGATLYGYRRVGTDLAGCDDKACQMEHYSLGVGRSGDAWLVAQEKTYLGDLADWREVPDDHVLTLRPGSTPTIEPLGDIAAPVRSR